MITDPAKALDAKRLIAYLSSSSFDLVTLTDFAM
jgi:hypothetical protein